MTLKEKRVVGHCYSKHSVKNSILNGKKWHYIIERTPLQYKCGSLLPHKTKKKGVGDTQLRLLGRELHIQRS